MQTAQQHPSFALSCGYQPHTSNDNRKNTESSQ